MHRSTYADLMLSVRRVLSLSLTAMAVVTFTFGVGKDALGQSGVLTSTSLLGIASDSGTNQNYDATTGRISANQRGDAFWINEPYNVSASNPYGVDNLIEVPAGTTSQVVLITNLGLNTTNDTVTDSNAVSVDPENNLWVLNGISGVIYLPFVNGTYASGLDATTLSACAPPVTGTTACLVQNIDPASLGNYVQLSDLQVDASGDIYAVDFYDGSQSGYGVANRIIEYSGATGAATVLVDNLQWANYSGRLAVTAAGDIYYSDGTNVYYSAAGSKTAATISGFSAPSGVSIDRGGNLFVDDTGNNRIVFAPKVSGATLTGAASVYNTVPASGQATDAVGVDGFGNMVFPAAGYGGVMYRQFLGDINVANPINFVSQGGASGATTINLIFSASSTFGSFLVTGAAGAFTTSGNTCTSGTTYTAGQSCSVNVTYHATIPGDQSGVLEALTTTGTVISEAHLSGYDYGPLLNVDPGTISAIGSGWAVPTSIAVDATGNTYVADGSKGGIYKNGSSTAIASGFSSPSAVAVDAAGNIYVADTGNHRIREVPYVSGAYGAAVTLYTGLSGPSGLALDYVGNLYIADSGNSRVLLLPNAGSQAASAPVTVLGSGFVTPVAIAVTTVNDSSYSETNTYVYVADNGTKTVVQLELRTSAQAVILSGLTTAAAVAVDQGSSIYVVDSGANTISFLPNNYGSIGSPSSVTKIVQKPTAIALDSLDNVYEVDSTDATVAADNRAAGAIGFGSQIAGTTSGAAYATLSNSGNGSVVLNSPFYTSAGGTADFTVTDGDCASEGTLYLAGNCYFSAVFKPVGATSYTDTLTFSSNAAADTMTLTGTGIPVPVFGSLTVTGFPTSTSIGTPGTVTVSAFDTDGNPMPSFTGTVTLTSSDPLATLPAAYTFQGSDAGVAQFSVTLNTGGTQSITATSGSISGSETGIEVGDYIWILNASGTTSQLDESGSFVAGGGVGAGASAYGGIAFDASGTVWSVTSGSNKLVSSTKAGATPTSHTGGGLSTPVSVAVDGAGSIWVANSGNNSVSEFLNSGTAQSGASGYGSSGTTALDAPSSVAIDATGGVWVTNNAGDSVTHILGAATPVVTPLSTAVANGNVGVEP